MESMDEFIENMKKFGVPEHVTRHFICIRSHADHSWGMAPVLIDGKPGVAIRYSVEDKAIVAFVAALGSMNIVDSNGNKMNADCELPLIDGVAPSKSEFN